MQIGAISSQNFKGYDANSIDLHELDEELNEALSYNAQDDIDKFDKTVKLVDKLVESKDMKKPVAIMASIGYAGAKTFAKAAGVTLAVDTFFNQKISTTAEKGLRGIANFAKSTSEKLIKNEGKKISKLANFTGNMLDKTNNFAKTAYKKLSKNNASKGLAVLFGGLSVLTIIPALLKKDNNKDGVADIMQKSQNVYEKSSEKLDNLQEKAGVVAELAQLLT